MSTRVRISWSFQSNRRNRQIVRYPLSKHKRGSLDPIFQVQRKLRHVSLYIILVLCPTVNALVKIQRFIRDKSNPKEVPLPSVSIQNDRNGVGGLNGRACGSEKDKDVGNRASISSSLAICFR